MNKYGTRTGVAELMCDQLVGDFSKKNAAEQDNAGSCCNSGMGMMVFSSMPKKSSLMHMCACMMPHTFLPSRQILFPVETADSISGVRSFVL